MGEGQRVWLGEKERGRGYGETNAFFDWRVLNRLESVEGAGGSYNSVDEGFSSRCVDPLKWPCQMEHFLSFGYFMKAFNPCRTASLLSRRVGV